MQMVSYQQKQNLCERRIMKMNRNLMNISRQAATYIIKCVLNEDDEEDEKK